MTRNDKKITCKDCGRTFIFRYDEQNYYAEQGYDDPVRCRDCRSAKKTAVQRQDKAPARSSMQRDARPQERELFPAVCASCGKSTMVPFKPREGGKPVYCRDCFNSKK